MYTLPQGGAYGATSASFSVSPSAAFASCGAGLAVVVVVVAAGFGCRKADNTASPPRNTTPIETRYASVPTPPFGFATLRSIARPCWSRQDNSQAINCNDTGASNGQWH
jgi:hypothetical protein